MKKHEVVDRSKSFSRLIYGTMILIAAFNLTYLKDLSNATIAFALALAFDPFDQSQSWKDRPKWQRIWLNVHLFLAACLLGMLISRWTL